MQERAFASTVKVIKCKTWLTLIGRRHRSPFAAGEAATVQYAEVAAQEGCIVIDNSGVFALEPDVPLVVPGVNPQVLADYRNRNIISVADSYVSQLLTSIKPLVEAAGLGRITLTNMLSMSAYGKAAVDELAGQSARLLNGIPAEEGRFSKQLAFNMLPLLADAEGSVVHERRLVEQVRKCCKTTVYLWR